MNGLIVTAWLIISTNQTVAIPYDNMDQCEAVAELAKAQTGYHKSTIYCIPGNTGIRK